MVEEADVVVLLFERLDLALDEGIELVERGLNFLRDCEVHGPRVGDGFHGLRTHLPSVTQR